ncbi:MAG: hypothetical protein EON58_00150 [Alphaproteobacteria bacterium]|nr:MAG: hypothetical protein EON58_00150 [Alphaproteobacteria bacterium]
MRRIDRNKVAPPAVLTAVGQPGERERNATLAFYAVPGNQGKTFTGFKVYRHEAVKAALKELFDDKCAFCEMDYGGAPWAVEHFRPKGAIDALDVMTMGRAKGVARLKPGYYWLAADWFNLMPACTDCNSPRGHLFTGGGRKRTSGKANFFPLANGCVHSRSQADGMLAGEQPMLIDPTVDDPAEHLEFKKGGIIGSRSVRGSITVGVLGLQRDPLVRKRAQIEKGLRFVIDTVRSQLVRLGIDAGDALARIDLDRAMARIKDEYLSDGAPFLSMCKQVVREELPGLFR